MHRHTMKPTPTPARNRLTTQASILLFALVFVLTMFLAVAQVFATPAHAGVEVGTWLNADLPSRLLEPLDGLANFFVAGIAEQYDPLLVAGIIAAAYPGVGARCKFCSALVITHVRTGCWLMK